MRILLTLIAAGLALLAATGLYGLKHRVEERRAAAEALERDIAEDVEALRVLEAEWAYLTDPRRVQDHALRYLRLAPPRPEQVTRGFAGLPYRVEGRDVEGNDGLDLRRLPQPRSKPLPPAARPGTAIPVAAAPATPQALPVSFAVRMRAAIERAGAEPAGDRQ